LATLSSQQTEYALNTYKHGLKKDIKQALIDIESNTEKLANVKSQIASAMSVVKLTQSLYKNGSATTVDISNATGNLQRSYLNQLQFEYQICLAKIELAKITGEKYW
jgi:outer membrane protein TolC